ncbi:hypothetical protein ACRALDRAFT_1094838 [Sodiomyces alcalophilus JCM 7366]|uniref:uncharacterized protein n=1 Tax=Sodiomyces alcalophilus JCM 7366 TaxID=591952 RepID=UPI0039B4CDF0
MPALASSQTLNESIFDCPELIVVVEIQGNILVTSVPHHDATQGSNPKRPESVKIGSATTLTPRMKLVRALSSHPGSLHYDKRRMSIITLPSRRLFSIEERRRQSPLSSQRVFLEDRQIICRSPHLPAGTRLHEVKETLITASLRLFPMEHRSCKATMSIITCSPARAVDQHFFLAATDQQSKNRHWEYRRTAEGVNGNALLKINHAKQFTNYKRWRASVTFGYDVRLAGGSQMEMESGRGGQAEPFVTQSHMLKHCQNLLSKAIRMMGCVADSRAKRRIALCAEDLRLDRKPQTPALITYAS